MGTGTHDEDAERKKAGTLDPGFFWEFVGKVGAPIFAATLVASLLSGTFERLHGSLLVLGLGMMGVCHWRTHHRSSRSRPR